MNATAARPPWLTKKLIVNNRLADTIKILSEERIATVCESGLCPNRNECFSRSQAAFLLLGRVCTRNCGFCSVEKGVPGVPRSDEPEEIADATRRLNLRFVVLTSVTRDDLTDGGAGQFADTINAIRCNTPDVKVEVLVPDFKGEKTSVKIVADARPDVFSHNIETVENSYGMARPMAGYSRSLEVLRYAKEAGLRYTKSSIMVGLGEEPGELLKTMKDLRGAGCDILTLGQYLRPRKANLPVAKYITPEEFQEYKKMAYGLGFKYVASGPFVRSSYMAEEGYLAVKGN